MWKNRIAQVLSFALPRELRQRIARVDRDPFRLVYGKGQLPETDPTLITRGRSKGLWLYDEVEQDAHAYAVLQKRKMAVIRVPWVVEAASSSRADKKAADLVKAQIHNLTGGLDSLNGFDGLCLHLLDATLKGFSVAEIDWQMVGSEVVATCCWGIDQRRFVFLASEGGFEPRLLTPAQSIDGVAIPDKKFVFHSFGSKIGDPRGHGLGSRLWWPTYFKRQDITFWLAYADRFGSPIPVGKYPPSSSKEEQDTLFAALQGFGQEAGMLIPEGMAVELLSANGTGSADLYEKLARWCDEQISECVLGETGTTNQSGSGGSRARDEVANQIRLEIVQADSDLLSATLNRTLVRWICEFNLPEATPPRVWRDTSQPEDLNGRINRDKTLFDMGFRLPVEQVSEVYGEYIDTTDPANQVSREISLVQSLGVGGTQSLVGFLQQLVQSGIGSEQAVNILVGVFGLDRTVAQGMVAQPQANEQVETLPAATSVAPPILDQVEAMFEAAAKNCLKGLACGGTCISAKKTCSKSLSPEQKEIEARARQQTTPKERKPRKTRKERKPIGEDKLQKLQKHYNKLASSEIDREVQVAAIEMARIINDPGWRQRNQAPPPPPPSELELAAIRAYSVGAYQTTNKTLRSADDKKKRNAASVERITELATSGLSQLPPYEGKEVYRGANLTPDILASILEGGVYSDKAFVSTSKSSPYPGNTAFVIKPKSGSASADISAYARFDEEEVLFPPNTNFRVVRNSSYDPAENLIPTEGSGKKPFQNIIILEEI